MITDEIQEIIQINQRVIWLFNRFPETINFDDYLVRMYKSFWGKVNVPKISSISRASRNIRRKYPERYKRKGKALEISLFKERANKEFYGEE